MEARGSVRADQVKTANKSFYDTVAGSYESIDGRRSSKLEDWLRATLRGLRDRAPGGRLLDIGSGSGFVTRCARGIFDLRAASDLSEKILALHSEAFDIGVAADADHLPFAGNSFDVITSFAVLHHLFDFEGLVKEAARVLKPGGIFYSDHDMDLSFARRFGIPLSVYRKFSGHRSKYSRSEVKITDELYHLSEWHENGIDSRHLGQLFEHAGFSVELTYHWFGLSPVTDYIFGTRNYPAGWAPLCSLKAVKLS